MPPTLCRLPAISLLQTTKKNQIKSKKSHLVGFKNINNNFIQHHDYIPFRVWIFSQPTGECFVGAASNGEQVLDDVLTIGGLATATLAQQDNGLILASGQEVPIGSLGHAVNVRGSVLPPAALEHLHHLERRQRSSEAGDQIGQRLYMSICVFTVIPIF